MKIPAIITIMLVTVLVMITLYEPVNAVSDESVKDCRQSSTKAASSNNIGQQTWILHSKPAPGGFLMDQTNSPANNGVGDKVLIASRASALWISDQVINEDTQYSSGNWNVDIFSGEDWGKSGNACQVLLGTWNGSTFNGFGISILRSASVYISSSLCEILQALTQKNAYVVRKSEYLAIQITNRDSIPHSVYTAEKGSGSIVSGVIEGAVPNSTGEISPTTSPLLPSITSSPLPTSSPSFPSGIATAVANASAAVPSAPVMPVQATPAAVALTPVMPIPNKSATVIATSSVPAAYAVNKTSNSNTSEKDQSKSAASENQSSFMMGILGVGLAILITIGLFMSIIKVNTMIVKRRNKRM